MSAFMRTMAVLLPVVMLWGCSTTGSNTGTDGDDGTPSQSPATMPNNANGGGGVDLGRVNPNEMGGGQQMGGNGQVDSATEALLAKRVVYFDFDRSEIKPEARAIIEAHAKKLAQNPSMRITLEGHCDERGTREYNLGLGERRSKAVQRVMSLMGVSSNQLELVSYGEERPAQMGHDERSWSMNRRVEFIY
ncbi:peptidoglycan-associated lipoprotein Pal [Pseudomonadota bacterium]